MPKAINDYFERYVPFDKPGSCTANTPELSVAEFSITAGDILKEGVTQKQSRDYVTGRLQKLIASNPELAKKNELPVEYQDIKKQLVEPYFEEANKKFDISKTADCLMKNKNDIKEMAIFCAAGILAPHPVAKAIGITVGCGIVATQVAACIQDGTEQE